jgi:hypothetical protein
VAEGARLESVFTRKGNVGSNPTLSAKLHGINNLGGFSREAQPTLPAYSFSLESVRSRYRRERLTSIKRG